MEVTGLGFVLLVFEFEFRVRCWVQSLGLDYMYIREEDYNYGNIH